MTGLRNKCALLMFVVMLGSACFAAERVRVSVFGLFHPRTVTVESSRPMIAKVAEQEIVVEPGQRVALSVSGNRILLERRETRLVGERVEFASRDGDEGEFTLGVPGKIRRMY